MSHTSSLSKKRTLIGSVISNKMTKTVVVAVVRLRQHPLYKKLYKVTKHYKAHDEKNVYEIGDRVVIQEGRPISKDKCWVVLEKIVS